MKKSLLVRLSILLLTISMLSGCLLLPPPLPDGPSGGGRHDQGRHQGHGGGDRR